MATLAGSFDGQTPREPERRAGFTLPFAALGLVGGLLVAVAWSGLLYEPWSTALLAGCTALAGARLGRRLSDPSAGPARATFGAGALAGWCYLGTLCAAALVTAKPSRVDDTLGGLMVAAFFGPLLGLGHAVPFLPATHAIAAAASRHAAVRRGALVAGVTRRAPWVALGGWAVAAAAFAGVTSWLARPVELASVMGAVALVAAAALARDARALARIGVAARLVERMRRRAAGAPPVAASVPVIDAGVGDGELEEVRAPVDPYRHEEQVVRVVRGDLDLARAIARRALAVDGLVLSCAAALAALFAAAAHAGLARPPLLGR